MTGYAAECHDVIRELHLRRDQFGNHFSGTGPRSVMASFSNSFHRVFSGRRITALVGQPLTPICIQ